MDLSLIRDTVRINVPVFEGAAEHPVDCEIILPDYCPDIARILKTEAAVCVDSKTVEGSRLTVSGNIAIHIVYIPENSSNIRCVTRNEGFTHVFDLREEAPDACVRVKARVEFVNCRPIGPRRVQIRASVAITAKVWVTREESFVSDCDSKEIELLKKPVRACVPINSAEKTFKVNDECEVEETKQPVASVIRANGQAMVQDCKLISNKVIAKGELSLRILYSGEDENSRLETVEHAIPISQIIDLEGVTEDSRCDVRFEVGDIHVETEADPDGENRDLIIEATVTASAMAFQDRDFFTVADAYCTDHDMQLSTKPVSFERMAGTGRFNEMLRFSVDSPDSDLAAINDCSCKPVIGNTTVNGKNLMVEGNMEISILASNSAGSPVHIEKTLPFSMREELAEAAENARCEPELSVMTAQGSLMGTDKVDLRVECSLDATVFTAANQMIVTDMAVDDSKEKECIPRKTLTLYFADKGERLWDIAKRYNTSMAAIKRENSLEDDELSDRRMLLIPKVRCRKN